MSTHPPTREQQAAIDVAVGGESCVIEALAGAGKTSTLEMIAEAIPHANISYLAFNKSIVTEAKSKMPGNVTCTTAHGLAFREVGKKYAKRLNGARMRSADIARHLRIKPFACTVAGKQKVLAAGWIAGQAKRTIDIWCQTGDPEPVARIHSPTVPGLDEPEAVLGPDGKPEFRNVRGPNHQDFFKYLDQILAAYWGEIVRIDGGVPFGHNHYLKLYQLSEPDIYADIILYDEAQDANGCMLSIVNRQADSQLVFVGDTYQQIYGWNGAVNALNLASPDAPRTHLTESFRFGEGIAMYANKALEFLDCPVTLTGRGTGIDFVGKVNDPDVVLFRTNAAAVSETMNALKAGKKPALVGGATEVVNFAKGAQALKAGQRAWQHPDLACFENWGEVQDYADNDPSGSDLRVLVGLVDEHTPEVIIEALDRCVNESQADIVLSTAHKAKGREWDSVCLWGDFPDPAERDVADEDVRLMYVAATRARHMLDVTRVGFYDFQRGTSQ